MYSKQIPYKNFLGQPKNAMVHFNFTEAEVMKQLTQLQTLLEWQKYNAQGEVRQLDVQEVVDFFSLFEEVMLDAWGVPSDDGERFDKTGKYEFKESALFSATIMHFVTDPIETGKFLDQVMPKGLLDLVADADAGAARLEESDNLTPAQKLEVAALRRQIQEAAASASAASEEK